MAYADQQMSGNRVVAIIIVALIHVALGYALITGLAYSAVKEAIERVTTVDIEEPEPEEEPPPPPPPDETVPPPPDGQRVPDLDVAIEQQGHATGRGVFEDVAVELRRVERQLHFLVLEAEVLEHQPRP
jgi:hypothetical protein